MSEPSSSSAKPTRPSVPSRPGRWPWPLTVAITAATLMALAAITIALIVATDVIRSDAVVERRLENLEQAPRLPAVPQPSDSGTRQRLEGLEQQMEELAGSIASLQSRIGEVEALRRQVTDLQAALEAVAARQTPTDAPSVPRPPTRTDETDAASRIERRLEDLEQSSITALGTLDERMQALSADLASLRERDAEMAAELENTRVALEAELVQWRERQSPPIWRLSAKLAGMTVLFSEGNRLADPPEAENTLRSVMGWLLEAGAEVGLRVVGYADIDGTGEPSNRITSQKRADTVRDMLTGLGIPADRIEAVGRSTEKRLVDNDSAGNANRRVEFEPFLLPRSEP